MKNDPPPSRRGIICHRGVEAGILEKGGEGYRFIYLPEYLARKDAEAISLTLPLREETFESEKMFPYFLGLIPEGWLLDLTRRTLKVDPENVFEILLRCCKDCIGATSIYPEGEEEVR
ncbi:MAG: HipA N-terminal domain-containing protein [Deltaproteobacteria bacterium]|nr:HipA N-terminal domain-containing protein [Deltaproteobacteria bacterium]